jgi:hypothetical protein
VNDHKSFPFEKDVITLSAEGKSLLFLDEDLGSLHFLFTIFYFFINYAWVLVQRIQFL